jgi:hypothetical protein
LVWPENVIVNFFFLTSHNFTVLSSDPEHSYVPSLLNWILFTGAEWPFIMVHYALAAFFQTRTVQSREAEANLSPSGLISTSQMASVWPMNLFGRALGLKLHAIISPSLELEMTCLRVGPFSLLNNALVTVSLCSWSTFMT